MTPEFIIPRLVTLALIIWTFYRTGKHFLEKRKQAKSDALAKRT